MFCTWQIRDKEKQDKWWSLSYSQVHKIIHQALHRDGKVPRAWSGEWQGKYPVSVHFLKQHWWHAETCDLIMRHAEYIASESPETTFIFKEWQNKRRVHKSCELNLCWCMKLKKKLRNRCQKTTGADWEAIFRRRRHFWHAPCWTQLFQRVSSPLSAHFQWCSKKIAAEKPDSKGGQNSGKSGAITSCWKTIMHTWVPDIAVTSLSPLDILAESNSNENMVWFWTFMSKISVTGLRL